MLNAGLTSPHETQDSSFPASCLQCPSRDAVHDVLLGAGGAVLGMAKTGVGAS